MSRDLPYGVGPGLTRVPLERVRPAGANTMGTHLLRVRLSTRRALGELPDTRRGPAEEGPPRPQQAPSP